MADENPTLRSHVSRIKELSADEVTLAQAKLGVSDVEAEGERKRPRRQAAITCVTLKCVMLKNSGGADREITNLYVYVPSIYMDDYMDCPPCTPLPTHLIPVPLGEPGS